MRSVSEILSRLFVPYHRQSPQDAAQWVEIWRVAYDLAYFILKYEEGAEEVAYATVLALKGDYKERKRKKSKFDLYQKTVADHGNRLAAVRRPLLQDAQELEKYVYSFCTPWEKEKVRRDLATENDFDVWFIKYVIQRCLWRNPFYMVVGLCSIIKTYDLEQETPLIWEQIVTLAPRLVESEKNDAEPFFDRWTTLKGEIEKRFGPLVRFQKGKLVRRDSSEEQLDLARRCFEMFSPRETDGECLVNETASPNDASASPNDNKADIKRFHLLLHSVCNGKAVGGAKLPERNVGLPNYGAQMRNDIDNNRTPPDLSDQKLDEVRNRIRHLLELRNAAVASSLVVSVDGVRQSVPTEGLSSKGIAALTLSDAAEMVEIRSRQADNRDILMTACPLSQIDRVRSVLLEGGQKVTFDIRYSDEGAGRGHYYVNISYRETQFVRMAKLEWDRFRRRRATRPNGVRKQGWSDALALVLGTLVLMALSLYIGLRFKSFLPFGEPKTAKTVAPSPTPEDSQPQPTPPTLASGKDKPEPTKSPSPRLGVGSPTKKSRPLIAKQTSDQETPVASIKSIFVESTSLYRDNKEYNRSVREAQITAITQSGLFVVTDKKDDADGVLRIADGYRSAGEETVRPRIETARGKLLWEGPHIVISRGNTSEEVREAARKLTSEITESIKAEIREEKTSKPPHP
jgi:hypothetical protein